MSKKFAVIATLIIFVIGAGVYTWQKAQDPYGGWETYRSEEVGYSVRYPRNYFFEKSVLVENQTFWEGEGSTDIFGNKKLDSITIRDKETLDFSIDVSVIVYENPEMLSTDRWVEKYKDSMFGFEEFETRKEIKAGNFRGVRSEVRNPRNPGASIVVIFTQNNKTFDLHGSIRSWASPEARVVVERILNSFRVN